MNFYILALRKSNVVRDCFCQRAQYWGWYWWNSGQYFSRLIRLQIFCTLVIIIYISTSNRLIQIINFGIGRDSNEKRFGGTLSPLVSPSQSPCGGTVGKATGSSAYLSLVNLLLSLNINRLCLSLAISVLLSAI